MNNTNSLANYGLGLLRIVAGYTFLLHGSAKLLGLPHVAMFDGLSIFSMIGIAGILELVGGILLVLGLFSRVVAFILSGEMAFAYFIGHASASTFLLPLLNGGEAAVLFCFIYLYIAVAGSGTWALDNLRNKQ
ncbi:DoxX family protein [Gallibacterium genomosp. 3]|uniref:LuxR family transcriptional regulator n=1 Tax=Gallibacterium genomosp. 3 TaxID=505345 RepID=A0A1A7QFE9_9PAST|nr:DoxX family protein [Gallibacterium genomosp. 3]OBX12175.1 LuxR family transcriptional regulator [Gallibacterium genomosp. 3]